MKPLLAGTDLTREELLKRDEPIAFSHTLRVLSNAERLLGPGWHLLLASRLTAPSHGPMGFAVVTAPNIRSSVDVLLRFMSTRAPFLWSTGTAEGDQFVLRFHEAVDMGDQRGTCGTGGHPCRGCWNVRSAAKSPAQRWPSVMPRRHTGKPWSRRFTRRSLFLQSSIH